MYNPYQREPGWFHGKIRGAGYRLTVPKEVYFAVHKEYPAIGLTTVYRTLELLVQMGLVSKFDFGDKRARYELSEGPGTQKHHHHLVCTSCGRIIDYTDFIDDEIELLEKTEKALSEKYNFKITNHIIQFYGLCEACQKN